MLEECVSRLFDFLKRKVRKHGRRNEIKDRLSDDTKRMNKCEYRIWKVTNKKNMIPCRSQRIDRWLD
mgnify:CR=1 FL=1